ncbi:MAG: hypothetical protein RR356_06865 [Bacteroidales bacterium]
MRRVNRLWVILSLIIFIGYQTSIAYFTHTHYFGYRVVVHFHPYSHANAHHIHTLQELADIDSALHFVGIVAPILLALALVAVSLPYCVPLAAEMVLVPMAHNRQFRGPPYHV